MKRKVFNTTIVAALVITIMWTAFDTIGFAQKLQDNILRIHIRAQDNTTEAQEIKLKVRDNLLTRFSGLFEKAGDAKDAFSIAKDNLDIIKENVESFLKSNNISYTATIKFEKTYFPTKEYDELYLPAGQYNAVIVELGEGKGDNWWCMLYPKLCIGVEGFAVSKEGTVYLNNAMGENYVKALKNKTNYKFKIVETLGKFWHKIS